MPRTIDQLGSDTPMLQAIRARIGMPSSAPASAPAPVGRTSFTPPGQPYQYVPPPPRPATDAFSGLKGITDFAGNVGNAVGGVMSEAAKLPVVGGALQGLSALADATVRTPVGLAALAADKVLNTGLTSAAEKANAGRPIWELPKTAANVAGEGIGQVASDPTQSLPVRALAGAARGIQIGGELVAPIAPGVGLLKGAITSRLGRAAEAAPVVNDAARVAPKIENIADLRARVAASKAQPLIASRFVTDVAPKTEPFRFTRTEFTAPTAAAPTEVATTAPRVTVQIGKTVSRLKDESGADVPGGIFSGKNHAEMAQAKADALNAKPAPSIPEQRVQDIQSASDLFNKAAGGAVKPEPKFGAPGTTFGDTNISKLVKMIQATTPYRGIQDFGAAVRSGEAAKSGAPQGLIDLFMKGETEVGLRGRGVDETIIRDHLGLKPPPDVAPIIPDTTYAGPGGAPPAPPAPPTGAPPTPPAPNAPASGWDKFLSVWNLPKALKASLDLSAPLRQGIMLAPGHPGDFASATKAMVHAVANGKFAAALDAQIKSVDRPGLYFRDSAAPLSARDEAFMSTFADKIPGVSQSQRGFNTFLNKLSADVYDHTIDGWKSGGKQFTEADARGFADVVNHFTGRGDLPNAVKDIGPVLNGLFFSPRYTISRFQSVGDALGLLKNPNDLASQAAAKDLVKFVTAGLGVLALAKLAGTPVEDDPRSAVFGKIQVGPTSVDIWGGSQQIARYAAQFLTEQRKVASGKNAGQIQDYPRGDTLGRFVRSKLAPTAGIVNDIYGIIPGGGGGPSPADKKANAGKPITDQVLGRDFIGDPVTASSVPAAVAAPLGWQNVVQSIAADDNKVRGAVVGLLSLLGAGTTTREDAAATTTAPLLPQKARTSFTAPVKAQAVPSAPRTTFTAPAAPTSSGPKPSSPDLASNLDGGGGADVSTAIQRTAQQSGIDPKLALATAMMESGLNPNIVGDNGDSHGLFQENVHGRGAGRAPDYSVDGQTSRFAADVKRLLATGFRGTPGEIAAAAQRPYDPVGYARKVDAIYGGLR